MDKNKNKHLFPKFSKFDHVVFTQSSLNCEDRFLQRFVMENKATRLVRHLNGGIDDPELSNVIMEYFCGNEDSDDDGFDDELDDHDGVELEDDDLVGVTEGASASACLQGHVSGSHADQEAVDENVAASIEHPAGTSQRIISETWWMLLLKHATVLANLVEMTKDA
ncbi:hypothetical protein CAPTEDRAFT_212494 [Capitella teleta]|uniref:Uncharacterized protein n=1 Tax=Capitella teleta TaxID=283909 RepID=R7V0I0_CAPTE|nr:hypothetical protein CAPTEDRAFT_212494 [Capitella teleta]|eukprot:ELU09712.1 hypothetical protein CAPTEDRAFT_212494 [Capitella teleta]